MLACQDAATEVARQHHLSLDCKQQDGHIDNRTALHGSNEARKTLHELRDDSCCFDRPTFPTWQCPWTENNIIYMLEKETAEHVRKVHKHTCRTDKLTLKQIVTNTKARCFCQMHSFKSASTGHFS
uniref:Uncharacterized protein n=1 Tax=Rhipicephalus zambeziensis TaxID=60191 RepID=A0A224Y8V4_9ACAR